MKTLIISLAFLFSFSALANEDGRQVIEINVTESGFEPKTIEVKPGSDVVLKVTRTTDSTCATEIKITSKNIQKNLPLNKTIDVSLGKVQKGVIDFACDMNMEKGQIKVKNAS